MNYIYRVRVEFTLNGKDFTRGMEMPADVVADIQANKPHLMRRLIRVAAPKVVVAPAPVRVAVPTPVSPTPQPPAAA